MILSLLLSPIVHSEYVAQFPVNHGGQFPSGLMFFFYGYREKQIWNHQVLHFSFENTPKLQISLKMSLWSYSAIPTPIPPMQSAFGTAASNLFNKPDAIFTRITCFISWWIWSRAIIGNYDDNGNKGSKCTNSFIMFADLAEAASSQQQQQQPTTYKSVWLNVKSERGGVRTLCLSVFHCCACHRTDLFDCSHKQCKCKSFQKLFSHLTLKSFQIKKSN